MNKPLPNKYIRKRIFDLINGISVDGYIIPCYDTRVTSDINTETPKYYVIMNTQSNEVDKSSKCEYYWESEILINIFTHYDLPGNAGSSLLADDILDEVKDLLHEFQLDVESGLEVIKVNSSYPDSLSSTSKNENVYRNFMRLELLIK